MAVTSDINVSCDQVGKFLRTCIDVVGSEETRATLQDPSSGRPGVYLVQAQQRVWGDIGVPVEAGRLAVREIEKRFPNDCADLLSLREQFSRTIDSVYLQCLEDRRPSSLKKKGKMPRNTVLEFFDACNLKLDTEDVRQRLRSHIKETGAMPDAVVNEVHDEVMELLGFEREHGQTCFKEFGAKNDFAKDREVATGFARWRGKTTHVCLTLLNEHQKEGGELNIDEEVKPKLTEFQAKEALDSMSIEDRSQLLEKNAKKVNVFRNLPVDARKRYIEKLSEEEKMELAKSEILMMTLMQSRQLQISSEGANKSE